MGTSGRHASRIIRRLLWGHQRSYSSGTGAADKTVKGFAALDAKVEKLLPKKMLPLYHHEAGLKSIFFWAPSWKWVLVIAGMADYTRPADKLSPRQGLALAVTGFIWARWSLVIIPKNWNLFSVNIFLGLTGCMQLARIYLYHRSQRGLLHGGVSTQKPAGFVAHKQVQYVPPPASPGPGTMIEYAPGVQPPQESLSDTSSSTTVDEQSGSQ